MSLSLLDDLGPVSDLFCNEGNTGRIYHTARGLLLQKQEEEWGGWWVEVAKETANRDGQFKKKKGKNKTYSSTSFYA